MKKFFCLLLTALMLVGICTAATADNDAYVTTNATGEMVVRVQIRLRDLGYLNFKPTGNYRSMSVNATIAFQQNQTHTTGGWISADGNVGPETQEVLFSVRATRANIPASVHIPIGSSLKGKPKVHGELTEWSEVKNMLIKGTKYKLTDYNTGATFYMVYAGGDNHAELECATKEDAALILQVFGGEHNFSKRPFVISINGKDVASSLQGCPHGTDSVSANDFDGHCCLFFKGSLSHVGNLPDVEHLKQVYVASGT